MNLGLSHGNYDVVVCLALLIRNHAALYGLTVHGEGLDAFFHVVRVYNFNVIGSLAELTGQGKVAEAFGYTGINA